VKYGTGYLVTYLNAVHVIMIIIIISLLMSPLLGHRPPYGLHIKRTGHNPPREPSAGWWVLTTGNAAGTNSLTCLTKHGGAGDNKFLVTHPMTGERCLTSAIARHQAPQSRAVHFKSLLNVIRLANTEVPSDMV
jgi:hypothetical protein